MMQSEDKLCVVVLFGGMSSEHEVSRVSAGTFVDNLDRARYEVLTVGITREGRWLCTEATSAQMADGSWEELPGNMPCVISPDRADHGMILFTPSGQVEKLHVDVVIPALHGLWGEDGTVQGLLELAGIPYVGCGVLASAVCMDKAVANALFEANGVPHTKWVAANRWEIESDLEGVCDGVEQKLGWPVFVKPANAGSSVGISKVSSREELKKAIRKETIANTLVPVVCGSSYKNRGVQKLLDAIVDYMPAPTDVEDIKGVNPETEEQETRPSSDDAPFAALAFKIATDPFVGKLAYFRVYSGKVEAGTTVYNSVKDSKERMGRILQMHSNHRKDIDCCYAGDIAAVVGLKNTTTGDTLCDEKHPIILESMNFPEPVIRVAIEPKTKAGSEKMGIALSKLAEEDPTFRTWTDEETGQTLISGMDELHLEIIIDRLMREFKVEADIGKPQIAYRETITAPAHGDGKLVKQSGGRGQYGHVVIDVKPNERGKGLTIENKIVGGAIPKEYMNAVYAGLNEAMTTGVVAGYPVVDVHVEVVDGSYHEVDSNENAFKMAAIFAMKDAFKKAKPIMLEPIMSVEASTPTDYQGDIMGDLNRRRGQISNMENKANACILKAMVPLSEMFGYSTAIRTLSSGRASYSMEPSHFEQVPQNLVDQIVSEKAK